MTFSFEKFRKKTRFIQEHLHYFGFVIVGLLIFQGHRTSVIYEDTLRESIQQQEALRSILWTNLLTQRATVLVLSPTVTKDPRAYKQASRIIESLPNVLNPSNPESANISTNVSAVFNRIQKISEQATSTGTTTAEQDAKTKLLVEVEKLGNDLNEQESEKWFDLLGKNTRLLKDLAKRRIESNLSYGIFLFYLVFLGWTLMRKKRAEGLLKQSERKGRVLTEASFEGLVILNGVTITEVNPAFETLFGIAASSAIGKPISEFIDIADQEFLLGSARPHDKNSTEAFAKHKDSQATPIEISVKKLVFEDRLITIVAMRDLTEKKRSEDLKIEKEAAEKSNLAKSAFLANMSHELRTPMHGILSFARFGQQKFETATKEKLKSYFDEIYDSGSRLMSLLNDILDLSKLEAGKIVYSVNEDDLRSVAEAVDGEMKAFSEERGLHIEVVSDLPRVLGSFDSQRVMQVVRNLLSNAIKFSEKDSTIRIDLWQSPTMIGCSVRNRGVGIPNAELELVFDKFVQSSKTRTGAGGTGLGLAISKEIIQQHHGKIWAESTVDGETKFSFEIPKLGSGASPGGTPGDAPDAASVTASKIAPEAA